MQEKPLRGAAKNADSGVEAAVFRLTQLGMPRDEALRRIDKTLAEVLAMLATVGVGGTSYLRQMNLAAGMKLNALRVAEANAEDARDGI